VSVLCFEHVLANGFAPKAEATRLKLRHLQVAQPTNSHLSARFSGRNFSQTALASGVDLAMKVRKTA